MAACFRLFRSFSAFALAGVLLVAATAGQSEAAQLKSLMGSWKGLGHAVFEGNRRERIKCRAYYTGGGTQLNVAVLCSSTSYKIEIRSKLEKTGSRLTGTWEERTFNATGATQGTIDDDHLKLAVQGGGLNASMRVDYSDSKQTVRIRTNGVQLQLVSIDLTRN